MPGQRVCVFSGLGAPREWPPRPPAPIRALRGWRLPRAAQGGPSGFAPVRGDSISTGHSECPSTQPRPGAVRWLCSRSPGKQPRGGSLQSGSEKSYSAAPRFSPRAPAGFTWGLGEAGWLRCFFL